MKDMDTEILLVEHATDEELMEIFSCCFAYLAPI
jgi:hypothetical protein